jgi:hypothetical protein
LKKYSIQSCKRFTHRLVVHLEVCQEVCQICPEVSQVDSQELEDSPEKEDKVQTQQLMMLTDKIKK